MAFDLLQLLQAKKVVLASNSSRRTQILQNLGLDVSIIPSRFTENLEKSQFASPADYVIANARGKAIEVYDRLCTSQETSSADVVIGADTVVVLPAPLNLILEKPKTYVEALDMLKALRDTSLDRTHSVLTGVCIVYRLSNASDISQPLVRCFYEETLVTFGEDVSDAMLQAYVNTNEPMDKAGAYGYQSGAGLLISKINGCYYNVVGLPIYRLFAVLRTLFEVPQQDEKIKELCMYDQ